MTLSAETLSAIRWNAQGLLPAVVQDYRTRQVLMLAYMNAESLQATLRTGQATFWSRSRQELWRKGATSGNTLRLIELHIDCDADAFLLLTEPAGPTCHTLRTSCFFRTIDEFEADPRLY